MTPKVPTIESGTATLGMMVAEALRRKRNRTITTRATVSSSENCTSCTDARMVADGVRLRRALEVPLREVHVRLRDGGAEVLEPEVVGRERRGVRLDADGGLLPAAEAHQADARQLRDLLREARVGQVLHPGQRQHVGGEREGEHRRIGGGGLAVDRRGGGGGGGGGGPPAWRGPPPPPPGGAGPPPGGRWGGGARGRRPRWAAPPSGT